VVETEVVNAPASAFTLEIAELVDQKSCHRAILVRPELGSRVIYARPRGGDLFVTVLGPASWTDESLRSADRAVRTDELAFRVSDGRHSRSGNCRAGVRVRLPIQGLATFGEDLREIRGVDAEQLVLLSGKLMLYGRAIPRFLLPLDSGPFRANALYLAQEISVPGGSRIASVASGRGGAGSARSAKVVGEKRHKAETNRKSVDARWYGFADVVFGDDGGNVAAIVVEAATNAREVELYLPAPFDADASAEGNKPDVISLSLSARLAGDPNLLWLYGVVLLTVALLSIAEKFKKREPAKDATNTHSEGSKPANGVADRSKSEHIDQHKDEK